MRIGVENCLPGNTLHTLCFLWLPWCSFFLAQESHENNGTFKYRSETVGPVLINTCKIQHYSYVEKYHLKEKIKSKFIDVMDNFLPINFLVNLQIKIKNNGLNYRF